MEVAWEFRDGHGMSVYLEMVRTFSAPGSVFCQGEEDLEPVYGDLANLMVACVACGGHLKLDDYEVRIDRDLSGQPISWNGYTWRSPARQGHEATYFLPETVDFGPWRELPLRDYFRVVQVLLAQEAKEPEVVLYGEGGPVAIRGLLPETVDTPGGQMPFQDWCLREFRRAIEALYQRGFFSQTGIAYRYENGLHIVDTNPRDANPHDILYWSDEQVWTEYYSRFERSWVSWVRGHFEWLKGLDSSQKSPDIVFLIEQANWGGNKELSYPDYQNMFRFLLEKSEVLGYERYELHGGLLRWADGTQTEIGNPLLMETAYQISDPEERLSPQIGLNLTQRLREKGLCNWEAGSFYDGLATCLRANLQRLFTSSSNTATFRADISRERRYLEYVTTSETKVVYGDGCVVVDLPDHRCEPGRYHYGLLSELMEKYRENIVGVEGPDESYPDYVGDMGGGQVGIEAEAGQWRCTLVYDGKNTLDLSYRDEYESGRYRAEIGWVREAREAFLKLASRVNECADGGWQVTLREMLHDLKYIWRADVTSLSAPELEVE